MVYNSWVNTSPPPLLTEPLRFTPATVGTALCVVSAVAYTAANICLRHLSDHVDQVWIVCLKEAVTVAAVGPWVVWQGLRGRRLWPARQDLIVLVLVGVAVELIGNLGFLWAMEIIGISLTIPATTAMNLSFCALFGWLVLREGVTPRTIAAVIVLVSGIVMLKWGTGQASALTNVESWRAGTALGVACIAGVIFASMAVAIRRSVTAAVPPAIVMLTITGAGVLSLGPLSLWRMGFPGLLATAPRDLAMMLLAGVLNLIGFFTLSRGLQTAAVVRANMLGASQVAMAALAGMWLFHEPLTREMWMGIALTILGILLVEPPPRHP